MSEITYWKYENNYYVKNTNNEAVAQITQVDEHTYTVSDAPDFYGESEEISEEEMIQVWGTIGRIGHAPPIPNFPPPPSE